MKDERQKYSVIQKFNTPTKNAKNTRYILPGMKLYTRSGKKVTVINLNASWLVGKIGKSVYTWFDTGYYLGSRFQHPLDIDWKRSIKENKL